MLIKRCVLLGELLLQAGELSLSLGDRTLLNLECARDTLDLFQLLADNLVFRLHSSHTPG